MTTPHPFDLVFWGLLAILVLIGVVGVAFMLFGAIRYAYFSDTDKSSKEEGTSK